MTTTELFILRKRCESEVVKSGEHGSCWTSLNLHSWMTTQRLMLSILSQCWLSIFNDQKQKNHKSYWLQTLCRITLRKLNVRSINAAQLIFFYPRPWTYQPPLKQCKWRKSFLIGINLWNNNVRVDPADWQECHREQVAHIGDPIRHQPRAG